MKKAHSSHTQMETSRTTGRTNSLTRPQMTLYLLVSPKLYIMGKFSLFQT
ncbi:hypothetical protein Hanom_Chr14g01331071 [Helianthus anomalus]